MASTLIDRLDGLSSSAAIKGPVKAATTANITLSGEQTIDGVAIVDGDRVLVKDQTTGSENGIYVADTGPWRRSKDFNRTRDVLEGTLVVVTDGTAGAGRVYRITTANPIVVGTTSISFSEAFAVSARSITAGAGLTGGGDLSTDRTIALNATSIASLALADTAGQARASVAEMQAVSTSAYSRMQYAGSIWSVKTASDYTAAIAADTQNGMFIASTFDATKVWVREHPGAIFVEWFGAGTSVAAGTNVTRIQAAMNVAKVLKTAVIFGYGTYNISSALAVTECSSVQLIGMGPGTNLNTTSATAVIFSATGSTVIDGLTIRDMRLTASVARTGTNPFIQIDPMIQYSYFTNLVMDDFNSGIWLKQFIQVQIASCKCSQMSSPPAATYGIRAGTQAASNQGANLYIRDTILRGNGNSGGSSTVANWTVGLLLHDVEGVFTNGLDIADFDENLREDAQTRIANCFFDSSFFDATQRGASFAFRGAGIRVEIEFCASWFASAGRSGTPTATDGAYGLLAAGNGSFGRVLVTACRFYNNAGNGTAITAVTADIEFNDCNWYSNSKVDNGPSIYNAPGSTGGAIKLRNCTVLDSGGTDSVQFTSNASGYVVDGLHCDEIVSFNGAPRRIVNVTASNVAISGLTVASAATLPIPPCGEFFTVTGTTTITAIAGAWAGHKITLLFASALTVTHGAPITLKGSVNASVPAGFTMDFVYNGSKWFETSRSF